MIPMHDILTHLFAKYGTVSAENLAEIDQKVRTMVYSISQPLVTVYDKVEELTCLATASGNPYTIVQQVQIGLQIIKNTRDFEAAIRDWYARPATGHTWTIFKSHFDSAHALLRQIRGPDMQSSSFQQVNLLATSIRTDMEAAQEQLLQAIAENTAQPEPPLEVPSPPQALNQVLADATQVLILELLQQLNANMQNMSAAQPSSTPRAPNRTQTSNNTSRNTTARQPARHSTPKTYCWSHGMCAHDSGSCRNKKDGHRDDATSANKQNGSMKGCGNV
jgi:hypothetical protein